MKNCFACAMRANFLIWWQFKRYTFISTWVALKRAVGLEKGMRRLLAMDDSSAFFRLIYVRHLGVVVVVIIVWDQDDLRRCGWSGRPRRIRLWLRLLVHLLALSLFQQPSSPHLQQEDRHSCPTPLQLLPHPLPLCWWSCWRMRSAVFASSMVSLYTITIWFLRFSKACIMVGQRMMNSGQTRPFIACVNAFWLVDWTSM